MRFRLILVVAMLILVTSIPNRGGDKVSIWIFYTGEKFLDIKRENPDLKGLEHLYVAGISDALNVIGSTEPEYEWVASCTAHKGIGQLTEIFRRWLQNHPERWHEPAPVLFTEAIRESCRK